MQKTSTISKVCSGLFLLLLMIVVNVSFAQRTIVVDSTEYGGLNHIIASDTTETGARVDSSTVYVLKRGETYILNGAISHTGYTLTIIAEEGDGPLPKLVPGVSEGGEFDRAFTIQGDLVLQNLYVTNRNELGGLSDRIIRVRADSLRIALDGCEFDDASQSCIRLDNDWCSVFMTNCLVSRIGTPDDVSNGRVIDDRGNNVDTVFMQNNTFYNVTQRVYRTSGGVKNYIFLDQNTCVNIGVYVGVFGEVVDFTFTNNLVINPNFLGEEQDSLDTGEPDPADLPAAKVVVDTVNQAYLDAVGASQNMTVSHNNMMIRQSILDARPRVNPDPASGNLIVSRPDWNPAVLAWMELNGTTETNISEDVEFKNGPVDPTVFIQQYWADPLHENVDPWDMTGYPYEFNYRDNSLSATASSTGEQLGDLNWVLTASGIQGLLDAIADAESLLEGATAGGNIGQYPQSAIDDLQEAIDAAKDVAEDPASSVEDIEAATISLSAAVESFEGSLVTGLIDQFGQELTKVYPNPTTGILDLQMNQPMRNISIWNTVGRQVMRIDGLKRSDISINMAGFESGIYILNVQFDNGEVLMNKILKY